MVARTWAELEEMLHVQPVTVALVDPSADGASRTVEFERVRAAYPSVPVIAYVLLTPTAFRAVTQLSRLGLEHVLLYSHDDSPAHIVDTIEKVRANPLTERFVQALKPQLDKLPLAISKVIVDMFAEPHRYPNAQDIATSANVKVINVYRAFDSARLAAPKRIVMAAKLLRAYSHLCDPGQSVRGTSAKLAYRSPRVFADHMNEALGVNPSELTTSFTEDQLVARLLDFVTVREKAAVG